MMDSISTSLDTATPMDFLPRPAVEESTAKEDFVLARKNMKEIIEQAMSTLPMMVHLMQEAQSDKMYSAGATMFKTLTDLNKDLAKLSKEESKSDSPAPVNQTYIAQQTVYEGTTESYLAKLKAQREQVQLPAIEAEVVEV